MFQRVDESRFIEAEHEILRFWEQRSIFRKLQEKNRGKPKWSFLDGPITANNPMGVHHAWGRTYKDAYQRYFAMTGHELRYQNGFDCQGLWVEVEVEKELGLGTKRAIVEQGIDRFVQACKRRVLRFAARQTEQSVRLGYWMEWDDPNELRRLAEHIGDDQEITLKTAKGKKVSGRAEDLTAQLGHPEWGGSYFTFSTENNETIWTFLKKCHQRRKIYLGHDVMPWSGRAGSAYSQMEIADGRKLTTHRSCFVRFLLLDEQPDTMQPRRHGAEGLKEYLLVWTTTPWTLTANVAAAVNPELEYVRIKAQIRGDEEPAYYYFAKENLDHKRLEREFKEGFGRPEWQWPEGVGKLKTLAQIFKEQGGFSIEGTLTGAEMIGWCYAGPFDELEAQQKAFRQSDDDPEGATPCHRVIDGGRDSKGNPHVVAGEGTGIVHIAPGCGDVDHTIGTELGLPVIAPLQEDGTYGPGFGEFTSQRAVDPSTADLVFESLKQKGALVAIETYPHIYPHCWRTGEELVFRLVDEWFIKMDWRNEIMEVTKTINWLPESMQGQERELEWLATMRDWMISKKRFWGLALPIWVNPEDPSDFEVIGSLAELKERALNGGEGWEQFEGHTPHRPWIDAVKIRSDKTGALLSRIEDVGNPWLDAGITPFSTMHYNHNREEWQKWYPADLVTECFPGQFRNWFYSLLALATMMRHDETDDPAEKRPFKTLLGHRLVMDELGRPMHKSDGTAIWFEEAAEQLGVDTLRWMYLAQNPAQDLRFGLRHPDQPVVLLTPEGEISETKEGLPTCKVTSTPADEIRRQVLIPLWNSYAFFVNYAVLDGFDPNSEAVDLAERPEIDRWILSNLQALIGTCRKEFEAFNVYEVCRAAALFIDDLSNWYIRRNRRRFWRPVGEGTNSVSSNAWDQDKLSAYQTLHEVLVSLSKLLAPCIPFLCERMYQNLTQADADAAESVHLCEYPQVNQDWLDESLNHRMQVAQRVVRMGHKLREEANQRVRQPLPELRYACSHAQDAEDIAALAQVISDELNVKAINAAENLDDLVSYSFKPNLKTLGPKYGKLLGLIRKELPNVDAEKLAPLRNGKRVTLDLGTEQIILEPDDVLISTEQASDWACASDAGIQIALSTVLTPELIREGMARDFIRHVQQLRKEAELEENERIHIVWSNVGQQSEEIAAMLVDWQEIIMNETRSDDIKQTEAGSAKGRSVAVGDAKIALRIERS